MFALLLAFLPKLPVIQGGLLSEDVVMALVASKALLRDGNLSDFGLSLPFQVIRNGSLSIPFWHSLIGPVLYYAPFLKIFGQIDFAFALAQLFLLTILLCIVIKRAGLKAGLLFIFLCVSAGVIDDALIESRSRLLGIVLVFFLLERWNRSINQWRYWLLDGFIIGLGCHFRDECIFLLPVFVFNLLQKSGFRKSYSLALGVVAMTILGKSAGTLLRYSLHAVGSGDLVNYVIGINIFAPGYEVLGLSHMPTLADFGKDAFLQKALFTKILNQMRGFLAFRLGPLARGDSYIIWISIIGIIAKVFPFRKFAVGFWLAGTQVAVSCIGLDAGRYYDLPMLVLAWSLYNEILRLTQSKQLAVNSGALLFGAWIFGALAWQSWRVVQLQQANKQGFMNQVQVAQRIVPSSAFVVTDSWILWNWYGDGKQAVLYPFSNGDTMRLLMDKFPDLYSLFFYPTNLHPSYRDAFKGRPVLMHEKNLLIYGPRRLG